LVSEGCDLVGASKCTPSWARMAGARSELMASTTSLGYDANGRRVRKKVSGRTRGEAVEKLGSYVNRLIPERCLMTG
jgi:hypothetical protein